MSTLYSASSDVVRAAFDRLKSEDKLTSKTSTECKLALSLGDTFTATTQKLQFNSFTDKETGKVSESIKVVLIGNDSTKEALNGLRFSASFHEIEKADIIEAGEQVTVRIVTYDMPACRGKKYFSIV